MVRNLGELASREGLEPDEIRLYLLLLANSDRSGKGKAGSSQLAIIFGHYRSRARVGRAVRHLADLCLIHFEFLPGDRGTGESFVLSYAVPGVESDESMPVP